MTTANLSNHRKEVIEATQRPALEIFLADRLVFDALIMHLASRGLARSFLSHFVNSPCCPSQPRKAGGSPHQLGRSQLPPRRVGCKGLNSLATRRAAAGKCSELRPRH